jgi:hypothetical protein
MKFVNLTPHEINLPHGQSVKPTGYVARVNAVQQQIDSVNGIPVLVTQLFQTMNLPEPEEGVYFIVPAVVRTHSRERKDLLSPTKLIRDTDGRVVGCGAFERNA